MCQAMCFAGLGFFFALKELRFSQEAGVLESFRET